MPACALDQNGRGFSLPDQPPAIAANPVVFEQFTGTDLASQRRTEMLMKSVKIGIGLVSVCTRVNDVPQLQC